MKEIVREFIKNLIASAAVLWFFFSLNANRSISPDAKAICATLIVLFFWSRAFIVNNDKNEGKP